jgi:hypothetical protein
MSAWRLTVQALYEMGGTASSDDLALAGVPDHGPKEAGMRKLAACTGRGGREVRHLWYLTDLGIAWCEGRAMLAPTGPNDGKRGGYRFVATWLAAWPGPIAIQQRETA